MLKIEITDEGAKRLAQIEEGSVIGAGGPPEKASEFFAKLGGFPSSILAASGEQAELEMVERYLPGTLFLNITPVYNTPRALPTSPVDLVPEADPAEINIPFGRRFESWWNPKDKREFNFNGRCDSGCLIFEFWFFGFTVMRGYCYSGVQPKDETFEIPDSLTMVTEANNERQTPRCQIPPSGWWCSRDVGHEGPCAARVRLRPF